VLTSQSLSAFVSHYGIAEAILVDAVPPAIAIGDFFHYCVAKGSKHIRAALVLVDHGFPEDAIVLSRALVDPQSLPLGPEARTRT
jgi:hypothetical protein